MGKTKILHKDYYEGILQLRNPSEEVIRCVKNQIKKKGDVFIAKEVTQKNGVDYYISSQRFLLSLGRKLKKSFRGELKTSRKLYTRDRITSKRVYRVTVLFRLT